MSTAYAEIYAFGHKDANATAVFLEIFVSPVATDNDNGNEDGKILGLRISPMHFVPTLLPSSKSSSSAPSHDSSDMYRTSSSSSKQLPVGTVVYKRAQDVNVGDVVWAVVQRGGHAHDMGVVPCIVQGKECIIHLHMKMGERGGSTLLQNPNTNSFPLNSKFNNHAKP